MPSPVQFRAVSSSARRRLPVNAPRYGYCCRLIPKAPHSRRSYTSSVNEARSRSWLPWIALPTAGVVVGYILATYSRPSKADIEVKRLVSNTTSTTPLSEMPTAIYDLTKKNIDELVEEMKAVLGPDRVNTQIGPRKAHSSTDWSAAPDPDMDIPSMILQPKTTEEVSAIAKACHKRLVPMIAFSGGTSLEGTLAMTSQGGVCIDFNLMNNVVALHPKDMDVVVQPGVGYEDLNQRLAPQGLFFPPDPGPGAKIGGMISQGCSGTNAYRYGTMKDWVLGLTMVLADGTIVKTRHRPRKSSAGYNLTQVRAYTLFNPIRFVLGDTDLDALSSSWWDRKALSDSSQKHH